VDSWNFQTNETGLEEEFWASESLVLDGDDISVWEFEWLIVGS
jgi:hypothetical protein